LRLDDLLKDKEHIYPKNTKNYSFAK